jgi:hypothetical protein
LSSSSRFISETLFQLLIVVETNGVWRTSIVCLEIIECNNGPSEPLGLFK